MPDAPSAPESLRKFRPLIILAAVALVLTCLALARDVLIPVAFAMLLAFVLTPLVDLVHRRGVHRVVAAVAVVVVVFAVLGIGVWALGQQMVSLAHELPQYRHNIRQKIADVRVFQRGGSIEKVQETVKDVTDEIRKSDATPLSRREPIPVVASEKTWVPSTFTAVAEMIATTAFVMVLVVFALIERQELRNRLIRLFGRGRIPLTTKALDEATQRISRYLLMQSLVNTCFGLAVTGGLWLIGVPYPLLWGVLAGALRFIPYVGSWTAALLPITMSLAVFPGWTKPLLVLGLFCVLEPLIWAVVEPLLYGYSIGVAQTPLLIAVALWTWLWGPFGLILATPLTVCLVVLGKYVGGLDFILTLVTDRPVLSPAVAFYQRLVAMDQDEAAQIAETELEAGGVERVYEQVVLPALAYARRDWSLGRLRPEDFALVAGAAREIVEGVVASTAAAALPAVRGRVVASAQDDAGEVALHMLADLLAPAGIVIDVLPPETLASELLASVSEERPAAIVLAAMPPGGIAHTRYLLKRLRARFDDTPVIVGRWCDDPAPDAAAPLLNAGAARVGTSLAASRDHVLELVPLHGERAA